MNLWGFNNVVDGLGLRVWDFGFQTLYGFKVQGLCMGDGFNVL